jgi:lipopolysaccharide transport system ATP-binding protein
MGSYAIKVEGLGKRYRIGERQQYKALRDVLADAASAPVRAAGRLLGGGRRDPRPDSTIWALKDVSFEVGHGEVLGIIGRNGAGKTTLLKILSRITEPTEGEVRLRGRVGSLLEVGTGFHPELTGRENIYLNGAILGMHKHEIERKFDEIVAFAEIERFLDTPVKHYSSGMYVRLAFAVAAHLEPEILLVDEVLAVGDAAFQKKCLGKMHDVAGQGRTVLFVSHNMAAVARLCERAILLEQGVLVRKDKTDDVIDEYLHSVEDVEMSRSYQIDEERLAQHRASSGIFIIERLELLSIGRKPLQRLATGDSLIIRVSYHTARKLLRPAFMISIANHYGVEIIRLSTMPISGYPIESIQGDGAIELTIERLPLTAGRYSLTLGVSRPNVEWILQLRDIASMNVQPRDVYESGVAMDSSKGLITLDHRWNLTNGHKEECR